MSTEPHRHFHDELGRLKDRLLDMSAMAEEKPPSFGPGAAGSGRGRGQPGGGGRPGALTRSSWRSKEAVTSLLALHQPVARDLRLILSALKIANDLERVGDHAVQHRAECRAPAGPPGHHPGPRAGGDGPASPARCWPTR